MLVIVPTAAALSPVFTTGIDYFQVLRTTNSLESLTFISKQQFPYGVLDAVR